MKFNRHSLTFLCLPALLAGASFAADAPLTLHQCYDLALKKSESVQIVQEDYEQAIALYRQALGSAGPNLSFVLTDTVQDTSGVDESQGEGVRSSFLKEEQANSRFTLHQPIFAGLKEISAMKGYKAESRRQQALYEQAKLDLFTDVSVSFYLVMRNESDLKNLMTLAGLTRDRVEELRGRVKLGKSRPSEVLTSDSLYDSLRSQIENTRGAVIAARDLLSFYVGRDLREVPLTDAAPPIMGAGALSDLLNRIEDRRDIQAFREAAEALRFNVSVSRSAYWPTVGVTGNYYTKRTGILEPVDWDVIFDVDVPIFQSGRVAGAVKESKSQYHQAQLALDQGRRRAQRLISQAHATLVSSLTEARLMGVSYEKAKRSYELQVKEYRHGLVNNLDVLQALNSMQQSKRDYERVNIQNKVNWNLLKTAVGEIP